MSFDFDRSVDRAGTGSIKYAAGRGLDPNLPDGYLPMWIADMDFACPAPILDALHARLDREILGYTQLCEPTYFEAVCGWFKRRFGWEVKREQLLYSSGIVTAIYAAVAELTKPGDGVILMTPAYHPFDDAIKRHGRTPVYSRLIRADGRYEIDFSDFEEKAKDPRNTLFFLCSPQNPTGRVWTERELRKMGEICFANGVFVVSDEIHADLVRRGVTHIPFATLFPEEKRLITCTAPSKTFNIAGLQHANLVIPDKALHARWTEKGCCGHVNALSPAAVQAAYTACEQWLEALKAYLDENFAAFSEALLQGVPRARFTVPEGTYLAWVDFSRLGLSDGELESRIGRAGVLAQYHGSFVDHDEGCMRINLACPRAVVLEAARRIAEALRGA